MRRNGPVARLPLYRGERDKVPFGKPFLRCEVRRLSSRIITMLWLATPPSISAATQCGWRLPKSLGEARRAYWHPTGK